MELTINTPEFPQALTYPDRAKAIVITDQQSYDVAAGFKLDMAAMRKKIVEEFKPMKEAANKAHKAITAKEAEYLAPITAAEEMVKQSIVAFQREQERIRQEAQRKLDEERRVAEEADRQRRMEEARKLQAAEAARIAEIRAREEAERIANATTDEDLDVPVFQVPELPPVEAFIAPPAPIAATIAAPTFERVKGLGIQKPKLKARLTDMRKLAKAVAESVAPMTFIEANLTIINRRVAADGKDFSMPGLELYEE